MEEKKSSNKDDEYGLPEVSYEPVNRKKDEKGRHYVKGRYKYDEKKDPKAKLVVGLVILFLIAGGLLTYFLVFNTPDKNQLTGNQFKEAQPMQQPEEKEADFESGFSNDLESTGSTKDWESAEPAKPEKGSITMVSQRTGRSYIIAGSFIDDDLAMDYGNKLATQGVNSKIIAPYGGKKYYRFSVADYPTIKEALNELEGLKTKYGNNIWVLKY